MLDGQFHGNGELRYPTGHVLKGSWKRGTLKYVFNHIFSDGLKFDAVNWKYCTSPDRRFQECRINGIFGVGETLLSVPCKDQPYTEKSKQKTIGAPIKELFSFIDSSIDDE